MIGVLTWQFIAAWVDKSLSTLCEAILGPIGLLVSLCPVRWNPNSHRRVERIQRLANDASGRLAVRPVPNDLRLGLTAFITAIRGRASLAEYLVKDLQDDRAALTKIGGATADPFEARATLRDRGFLRYTLVDAVYPLNAKPIRQCLRTKIVDFVSGRQVFYDGLKPRLWEWSPTDRAWRKKNREDLLPDHATLTVKEQLLNYDQEFVQRREADFRITAIMGRYTNT